TLSEPERELAGLAWDRLRQAGAELRLLNDPRGVASRYELLRRAHEAGLNAFRAVPAAQLRFGGERGASASECAASLGYPVFVRYANRHEGSLTPLIDSPAALERALALLLAAGNRLDELLVVE